MLIMIARHLAMSGRRYDVKDPLGSIRAVVDPDAPGTRSNRCAGHREGRGDARRRCRPLSALRMPGRNDVRGEKRPPESALGDVQYARSVTASPNPSFPAVGSVGVSAVRVAKSGRCAGSHHRRMH